ncbi:MAG: hypothetical protein AAGF76_00620 [Pseudomonadota bacterium]
MGLHLGNTINGSNVDEVIDAGAGDDGNDTIDGGDGNDTVSGGAGVDTLDGGGLLAHSRHLILFDSSIADLCVDQAVRGAGLAVDMIVPGPRQSDGSLVNQRLILEHKRHKMYKKSLVGFGDFAYMNAHDKEKRLYQLRGDCMATEVSRNVYQSPR